MDYEAEYEVDYLDWQVFGGIEAVGDVLCPQQIHEFVVTGNESVLVGNLSVPRSSVTLDSVFCGVSDSRLGRQLRSCVASG